MLIADHHGVRNNRLHGRAHSRFRPRSALPVVVGVDMRLAMRRLHGMNKVHGDVLLGCIMVHLASTRKPNQTRILTHQILHDDWKFRRPYGGFEHGMLHSKSAVLGEPFQSSDNIFVTHETEDSSSFADQ